MFVLMSSRKARDYKEILRKISDTMPTDPSVETIVAYFEKGAWKACRSVFPDVTMRGCVFHMVQAIYRKVQELGVQVLYSDDDATYTLIRKLMVLPFLPSDCIRRNFRRLQAQTTTP